MNKAFSKIVVGCLAFGVAFSVLAQLQPDTRTQSALSALARDTSIIQDQSKIPDQDNRTGYLSVLYDVSVHGGSGVIDLGPALPAGVAVVGGFAHVVSAIQPATATNALHIVAANDLLTAGTTLNSAGLKQLIPGSASFTVGPVVIANETNTLVTAASVAAPVVTTADNNQLRLTWTGSAATNGTVFIVLDLIKFQ